MLDKPKCKLCGVRHWSNEAHDWPAMPKVTVQEVQEAALKPLAVKIGRKAYLREYMRDYMRKRRKVTNGT